MHLRAVALDADSTSSLVMPGASGSSLWHVIHRPRVAVRDAPSTSGSIVHAFSTGDVFLVEESTGGDWVRLAQEERWVHNISGPAFMLVDGTSLGLGALIEPLPVEEGTPAMWPYAAAINRAMATEVPFTLDKTYLLPIPEDRLQKRWLSTWHQPPSSDVAASPGTPDPQLTYGKKASLHKKMPRLCVALLVRGIGASPIESFICYHLAIGFERIVLFFDKPEDSAEQDAIQAAKRCAADANQKRRDVQVHLCGFEWWAAEKLQSRYFQRAENGEQLHRETVDLHEQVHDVQARQCLVVDHAIRAAHRDGFDWLLHIDSDEVLYLKQYKDARDFFRTISAEYDQVVFHNLEAAPEKMELHQGDWFKDVSLFKVHQSLLQDDPSSKPNESSEKSKRRRERMERWRERKIAKGHDAEDLKENHAFDSLMFSIRIHRREFAKSLALNLPKQDTDSDALSESDDADNEKRKEGFVRDVPTFFNAYGNGKAACRLKKGVEPPLPVGVHRCHSDKNKKLNTLKCVGFGAPVVLHYANCGYKQWRRKYELLCAGHGTPDGAFSVSRGGIGSLRTHLAQRELTLRGSEAELEGFYRTFIMGNEFGEWPFLAVQGLVVRITAVKDMLKDCTGRYTQVGPM